jgi:hypothetical protein
MMQKKLTITVDEEVYDGLYKSVGRRRISRFIETVVRPLVVRADMASEYEEMARDDAREAEALEWTEATVEDIYAAR